MSVYVDNARLRYGRMLMSHMMADTEEELHAMADAIGISRRHFQGDHYDICEAKRRLAVMRNATMVTSRQLVELRRGRR